MVKQSQVNIASPWKKLLSIITGIALIFLSLTSLSPPDTGGSFVNSSFLVFPFFTLDLGSPTIDLFFLALYIIQGLLLLYVGWKKELFNKWFLTSIISYSIWLGMSLLVLFTGGYLFILFVWPLWLAQIIAFCSLWVGVAIECVQMVRKK